MATTLANIHRDPKRTGPYKPEQFMPYHEKPAAEHREADLRKRLLAAFGVKLDRRRIRKKK